MTSYDTTPSGLQEVHRDAITITTDAMPRLQAQL